jgi:hypothetical protein
MPNTFSKEERVAFEDILEGFNDALVLSRNVAVYNTDSTEMERSRDTIWRPMPYIATSVDGAPGTNISSLYKDMAQLSVPATLGFSKTVPWTLNAKELRDAIQENRLGDSAKQKLASDINVALMGVASAQGTLFVKRQAAASGFDDVAQCEAVFNEIGVPSYDRYLALSTRDYNNMASNLAGRQNITDMPKEAYRRAYVGMIASFDTYKLDYANRKVAAAGGASITISTQDAALNYYIPKATSNSVGGQINVDNRYQTVSVSSTTNVAAGDAFTIAAVNSVHSITKGDTGQLKTFRVISVTNSTTMVISPPIISNQVANDASAQYQNCVVNAKSGTSAIVFLNTASAYMNPFWQKDALEILPGKYSVPSDAGAAVIRASTDQGIELVMQKFYDIDTMRTKYRLDTLFGVVCKQPEMAGVMMFNQP